MNRLQCKADFQSYGVGLIFEGACVSGQSEPASFCDCWGLVARLIVGRLKTPTQDRWNSRGAKPYASGLRLCRVGQDTLHRYM